LFGLKELGASKQDDRSALDVEPQQVVPVGPSLLIRGFDLTLPSPRRRPARSAQLRWIWEDSIPRIKASLVAITITDPSTIVPCASRSRKIRCFEVSEVTIKRFNPAYGVKFSDMFYRATFADKILKGEKPGDIPLNKPPSSGYQPQDREIPRRGDSAELPRPRGRDD
jgi:hypothetical protein